MLKRIDLPDLTAFSQPEWNDAHSLSAAFQAVLSADNEEASWDAYSRLLYAIGNNHKGSYYSVVLGILPCIDRILREGSPWSQRTVLEALIDLYCSFGPEPGQELYLGVPLQKSLKEWIAGLASLAATLESNGGVAAKSARELLNHIHDEPR